MKFGIKKIGAWLGLLMLLSSSLLAQSGEQASEQRALDQALAIEQPSDRITALQAFLESHPNSSLADTAREAIVQGWAFLGEGQLAERNRDRALLYFRRALAARPQETSDRFFEEVLSRIPLAVSARGYRQDAIGLARELEASFLQEPVRLGMLGEFYLSIEAPNDAIRALERAAELAPDEARVHRALGAAYRQGLRLDDAAAEYQRAVGLEAQGKQTFYELANLYRAQGAYEDAIKLYQRQLGIEPKHIPSLKGLALTYLAQGKEDLATKELNKVREAKPTEDLTRDIYLQTQLAFYYLAQGKIIPARKAAEAALIAEPRYSWARIAAAEVDLAEARYFEAERHIFTALNYASFPTLNFTLGRIYLAAEDFDGALEQFAKAFNYSSTGFTAKLGGVFDARAEGLAELFARERQAALFVYEPPAIASQFKLAETLVRLDTRLRGPQLALKGSNGGRTQTDVGIAAKGGEAASLEQAATEFIEADSARRPFRSLYIAQRLAQSGQALELAAKLAQQALDLAEAATEPDGSMRDYPNYDRAGRLQIFRGRAADARGWALFKLERNDEAVAALSEAVAAYSELPEGKRALWHLAMAKEAAGELKEALNLYLASYEAPPSTERGRDVNRAIIEVLYRKVYGSLNGLDERLGKPSSVSSTEIVPAAASNASNASKEKTAPPPTTAPPAESETPPTAIQLPVIDPSNAPSLLRLKPSTNFSTTNFPGWTGEPLTDPKSIKPTTENQETTSSNTRPRRVQNSKSTQSSSTQSSKEPPANTRPRRVKSTDPVKSTIKR